MKELISCDLESVLTYLLDLTRGLSMTLKNENASQTESPSLISEILTKEPGLMRPARPNKSWAEDLPRSPFLLSFTARLRKAADGSSPRPCQEGKVVAVVQGLTHFLPRTSRDWRAGKCLSGLRWRRAARWTFAVRVGFGFFSRASLRRSPECQQLHAVLWKKPNCCCGK